MEKGEYRPAVLRPARDVRLVEESGVVSAYPAPHRTPVLPRGWAPLTQHEQAAVVELCETAQAALRLRLPSAWDSTIEYQVYELPRDRWTGVSVAAIRTTGEGSVPGAPGAGDRPTRLRLLGVGRSTAAAAQIAVDFFNWDLEAHGAGWRLSVISVQTLDGVNPSQEP